MRKNKSTSGCSALAERYCRMNGVCLDKSSWLMRSKLGTGNDTVDGSPIRQVCKGGQRVWHDPAAQTKRSAMAVPGGVRGSSPDRRFNDFLLIQSFFGSDVPRCRGEVALWPSRICKHEPGPRNQPVYRQPALEGESAYAPSGIACPEDVNRLADAPEGPQEEPAFMSASRSRAESGFLHRAIRADRTAVEFAPGCERAHACRQAFRRLPAIATVSLPVVGPGVP